MTSQSGSDAHTNSSRHLTPNTSIPPETKPSLGRVIFRNTLVISIGEGLIKLLNVVFNIVTIRWLGETALGQYATVLALVGLFGVFFELGLSQYVQRSIAQDRARAPSLFWNLVLLRLVLAACGIVAIPLLVQSVGYDHTVVVGTALYSLTFVFAAVLAPLTTVLQAEERFDVTSAVAVVNQVITVGLGLLLLALGYGFLALICIGFVAMPVQIALCLRALRRYRIGPLPFQWTPSAWPAFVRASVPFGLTSLALTLNFNADSVMLGWFRDANEVGWYAAAYRLVFSLVGLVGGFLAALTPSIAREHVSDPERVRAWTRTSTHWLMLFALPTATGIALLASRVTTLLYGEAFAPSSVALALLCWDIPLLMFTAFCGNVTAAVDLERPAARIFAVSVVLNIVLNLMLIPRFGMLAAAGVTVLTDAVSAIAFFALLHNHMQLGAIAARLARIGLAAALMGVAVQLAQPLPLAVVIAIGVVCYALLVWWLGLLDEALLAKMRSRLARS